MVSKEKGKDPRARLVGGAPLAPSPTLGGALVLARCRTVVGHGGVCCCRQDRVGSSTLSVDAVNIDRVEVQSCAT